MAVAVLASAWNPAKVRAPVNELQGAYSHPCPKELKEEKLGRTAAGDGNSESQHGNLPAQWGGRGGLWKEAEIS